ncbi:MAG: hypothetical protein ACSLFF_03410 [Solirubrobacterales bacterium]
MLAVVFVRLWYLQVLSGENYLAQADQNRVREIKVEAPRGEIIDRAGKRLTSNRSSWQVRLDSCRRGENLGPKRELVSIPGMGAEVDRIARSLHQSPAVLRKNMQQSLVHSSAGPVTVAADVPLAAVVWIQERREDFPGVEAAQIFERDYPYGDLATQLFGYVREISGEQLKAGKYEAARQGDRVGQDGLEFQYDRFLRGRDGEQRVQVNAADQSTGSLRGTPTTIGETLRLTLDSEVQKVGESAPRRAASDSPNHGGACVAINIDSGSIVGIGRFPTFDPDVFSVPVRPATYKRTNTAERLKFRPTSIATNEARTRTKWR